MPSLNLSDMLRISTRGDGLFELTMIEGHDRIFLAGKTIDQIDCNSLVGPAVVINFSDLKKSEQITARSNRLTSTIEAYLHILL